MSGNVRVERRSGGAKRFAVQYDKHIKIALLKLLCIINLQKSALMKIIQPESSRRRLEIEPGGKGANNKV